MTILKFFHKRSKNDNINIIFSKISLSLKSTEKIANKISKLLKKGDIVLLEGDLGAGKSVIVRFILQSLGVKNKITSPTFTIVNDYHAGDLHFYHLDLYRIEDETELENIGFENVIDDNEAIKFVEWPSKIGSLFPKKYFKIIVSKLGKHSRKITLEEYK